MKTPRSEGWVPPYSRTAEIYDELVGETLFEGWRENYRRLKKHMDMPVKVCADVACGTGLAARYLAEEGARVYAVDISCEMLRVARRRLADLPVIALRQDLRSLDLPEEMDMITCNGDSLNHLLNEGDLLRALTAFKNNLRPQGYLIFDVNTHYQLASQNDASLWKARQGRTRMYWKSSYDEKKRTALLLMSHVEEGALGNILYREAHRERGYDREEVERALTEAGFDKVLSWDASGLGPVTSTTRRLQFLARRGGAHPKRRKERR